MKDKLNKTEQHIKLPKTVAAFTIIELLVVIAVIAALAAITVIAYVGVTNQAHKVALSSGLSESVKALENYKTTNGITSSETYPTKLSDMTNLKLDNSINWTYYVPSTTDNTQNTSYCLQGTTNGITQSVSSTDSSVQTKPCLENGLVGWWKLNGNANDSSGLGNDGVIHGTTSATGPNNDGALYFNGTSSDYVAINNFDYGVLMPNAVQSSWTMSIWAKYTSKTSNSIVFGKLGFNGGLIETSSYFFSVVDSSSAFHNASGGTVDSSWHLLSGIYNNGSLDFYFDGVLKGSSSTASLRGYTNRLGIGGDNSYFPFNGTLDDARVYDRALSASEISNLYSAGAQ